MNFNVIIKNMQKVPKRVLVGHDDNRGGKYWVLKMFEQKQFVVDKEVLDDLLKDKTLRVVIK